MVILLEVCQVRLVLLASWILAIGLHSRALRPLRSLLLKVQAHLFFLGSWKSCFVLLLHFWKCMNCQICLFDRFCNSAFAGAQKFYSVWKNLYNTIFMCDMPTCCHKLLLASFPDFQDLACQLRVSSSSFLGSQVQCGPVVGIWSKWPLSGFWS